MENSSDKGFKLMVVKADALESKLGERTNVETLREGKTSFKFRVHFCDKNQKVSVRIIRISTEEFNSAGELPATPAKAKAKKVTTPAEPKKKEPVKKEEPAAPVKKKNPNAVVDLGRELYRAEEAEKTEKANVAAIKANIAKLTSKEKSTVKATKELKVAEEKLKEIRTTVKTLKAQMK